MLRRVNLGLVILIALTFIAHSLMSSMKLFGADAETLTKVGVACIVLICIHIAISLVLTAQTLYAIHRSGAGYWRGNELFWLRRISGLTIIIPLIMHLLIFRTGNEGAFRLQVFTTGRMISQILLLAAIALHVLINIRPALLSAGVRRERILSYDILLVLAGLLLLFGAAFVVYYIRFISW